MTKARKIVLRVVALVAILLAVPAVAVGVFAWKVWKWPPVNDESDQNSTWRADTPLTYAEAVATGHCPGGELPESAAKIQYVNYYAGYVGFAMYTRFEAPVEDCRAHARRVLEAHNASTSGTSLDVEIGPQAMDVEAAQALAEWARTTDPRQSRAPWFDVDAIKNGEIWGMRRSHTPVIFIDTDRGIFYYHIGD